MNSTTALVSAIIPTYNHARYVQEAIESALAQDYPAVEIIVVDDGSTDNTPEILRGYAGKIHYIRQPNQGLSAARNTGIRASRGDLIGLLDADDLWMPDYLSSVVPVLLAHPNAGAVYCGWRDIDNQSKELPFESTRITAPEDFYELFVFTNFLVPSGVVIRRECFDEAGLFDIDLRACEDRDMWLRISLHRPFIGVPKPLVRYRNHAENMTKDLERMETARRAVIAKHFGGEDSSPQTWPALKQRAFGGFYLRTALDLFRTDRVASGNSFLQKAFNVYPELCQNLDAFYEWSCVVQPAPSRGIPHNVDFSDASRRIFKALDDIFTASRDNLGLMARKNQAYSYAHFALGLLAYHTGNARHARMNLTRALVKDPAILGNPAFRATWVRALVGKRMIKTLKGIHLTSIIGRR